MARYIDADEITRRIVYYYGHTNDGSGEHYAYGIALKEINRTPTADVVEVVRCKDCESSSEPKSVSRYDLYCNNYDLWFCEKEQKIVCGTHFCSYGERRTDDDL